MMWSLVCTDRLLAGAAEEFALCFSSPKTLRLPCDEHAFLSESVQEGPLLETVHCGDNGTDLGCFAAIVILMDTWRSILTCVLCTSSPKR